MVKKTQESEKKRDGKKGRERKIEGGKEERDKLKSND